MLSLHGVSPFCPVNRDASQRAQRCAAPKSRHSRVAKGRSFWKGTRSLRGGRSPTPEGRGTRVLNAEPKGAAPAPKRWPSEREKGGLQTPIQLHPRASSMSYHVSSRIRQPRALRFRIALVICLETKRSFVRKIRFSRLVMTMRR
jgi:hypothetical protein